MEEKWRRVRKSIYYVSSLGRVVTLHHSNPSAAKVVFRHNGKELEGYIKTPHLNIKPTKRHRGYLSVSLYLNHNEWKNLYVHRLVAEAFIKNPNKLPTVNHKDGNHFNNKMSNLEWMSYSENNQHAYDNWLKKGRKGDRVSCYTLDGTLIDSYGSMREAERTNHMANGTVSQAIKHGWNYNGFFWSRSCSLLPEQVRLIIAENATNNKESSNAGNPVAVDQYEMDGTFVKTYKSATIAAKAIGTRPNNISRAINGHRKSCKGFKWKRHKK